MIMAFESKAEWDALTPDEQWQCMQLSEQHEAELNKLLYLFECPEHGQGCIPYAIDEVKRLQSVECGELRPLEIKFSPDDRTEILEKLKKLKINEFEHRSNIVQGSPYDGLSYGYIEKNA